MDLDMTNSHLSGPRVSPAWGDVTPVVLTVDKARGTSALA